MCENVEALVDVWKGKVSGGLFNHVQPTTDLKATICSLTTTAASKNND